MRASKRTAMLMRRWVKGGLRKICVMLLLAAATVSSVQADPGRGASFKEGQILVKPRAGLPETKFDEILGRHGGKAVGLLRNLDIHVVQVPVQAEDAVARALSRDPHVTFAEKDLLTEAAEAIPNDPEFANAWHLSTVQAAAAWDMARAHGITIAILDSGVDTSHPDLSLQLLPGWNSVSNNADTNDNNGHGTMVAGTAAAATNNGVGVAGIAWNASILPVRVSNLSSGAAYISDIANGLTWAADNGADVANISYHVSTSSAVSSAARYMRNSGGVVVVAAGNQGSNPGLSDNSALIAVSATTSTDDKASFSNYGNYIDVAAPGVDVLTSTKGGGYGPATGTSFASPATAGVVALIMGANPYLSADEVEMILETSADDLVSGSDWHAYYGHGRINAAAAVQMALDVGGATTDYESPSVAIFSPGENNTVSGMIPVEVNAIDNVGVAEVALYVNDEFIGVNYSAPYQFSWDSTQSPGGNVTLTAIAYDAAANEGVSSAVTLLVDNTPKVDLDTVPPLVEILNPGDGDTVSRTVTIQVNAADDVELKGVDLYIDGMRVVSDFTGAFAYDWNTRKAGTGIHLIEAIATDSVGNAANHTIQVTVGKGSTSESGPKGKGNKRK